MAWYVEWVTKNALFAAFVQFAILGTLGEVLGIVASRRKVSAKPAEWLAKALVWGLLGILIKYAFAGFGGFLQTLADKGMLPVACVEIVILRAFCLSLITNAQFGPLLMVLHRSSDNLITGTRGYAGIEKSLATLAWFWVPAHTVTFALPHEYQVGLAALWSVALGLIMGFTKRQK
ncbi:MAG: hypothetical protein NT080_04205 [Spirochaetes bacterium]|nr:hypothetical protein [Spirochaetota bacterium]